VRPTFKMVSIIPGIDTRAPCHNSNFTHKAARDGSDGE
jgi:hypothetical protein